MKCTNCQAEWTPPPNISLSKCPYCQSNILPMLNQQADVLSPDMILKNMLQVYGRELLLNPQRLSAMISDLFTHDSGSKRLLLLSVRENIPMKLSVLEHTHPSILSTHITNIKHRLSEDVFLKEEAALLIIDFWTKALEFEEPDDSFEIVWQGRYCGFINYLGEMITTFKYENANFFKDGLAKVMRKGKYGFIDKIGNEVIPLKYDWACDFSEGLAMVSLNHKKGFIDKTGTEIIPLLYYTAKLFRDEITIVKLYKGDNDSIINKKDYEVIPTSYDFFLFTGFPEGLAVVISSDEKFGFIDKTGREVIPLIYNWANKFSEGLACVLINEKFGYIDKTGREIIPFIFEDANSFSDELACVSINKKWGYIDKTGQEVIPFIYSAASHFNEGYARAELNGKWGYIDKTGREVIPFIYSAASYFNEGYAIAELNGKWGCIDKTGQEAIPFIYSRFDHFRDGLALVSLNHKYGFIDKTGKEIIPIIYSSYGLFHDQLVSMKLNGKEFIINKKGKIVK